MASFKDVVRADVKAFFHNDTEFADVLKVKYDGVWYQIPVILDYDGTKDRNRPSADHADGLILCDVKAYIAESDLPKKPRKGTRITIGGELYNIERADIEAGEIVLYLNMFDE